MPLSVSRKTKKGNKKIILLGLCCVLLNIGIIYFGQNYLQSINSIQAQEAKENYEKELVRREASRLEEINLYKPNGNPRSVLDDLHYFVLTKGQAIVATFGSSVTNGDGASSPEKKWHHLLNRYLVSLNGLDQVKVQSNGFPGYSTEMIVFKHYEDKIIEAKPDIVLFETFVLNDHGQSIPLQKTKDNLDFMIKKIKENLPNTKIIILSPNPKADTNPNGIGAQYKEYVDLTAEVAHSHQLDYMDIYSSFIHTNLDLNALLKDGVHPNDLGYQVWFDTVKAYFSLEK